MAQVSKGVVALLREGDFIDCVSQVAMFQQTAGVFSSIPTVLEALHPREQPVDNISPWNTEIEQMRKISQSTLIIQNICQKLDAKESISHPNKFKP